MTQDEKIHDIATAMIRRHSMNPEEWQHTRIGGLHPLLANFFSPQSDELVVVSALLSPESWYVFTTRRLVSCFKGRNEEASLEGLEKAEFGNFKGYGKKSIRLAEIRTEVATLHFSNGLELQIEYETGKASMAPIYATRYWQQKHPILDKLMDSSEQQQFKSQ